jgi:hypothetical protein
VDSFNWEIKNPMTGISRTATAVPKFSIEIDKPTTFTVSVSANGQTDIIMIKGKFYISSSFYGSTHFGIALYIDYDARAS